ncbi:MAG: hypothetical protein JWO60_1917 [Frankiales bacterium]|nr:hypothetical protein [Frankiales bacterium]
MTSAVQPSPPAHAGPTLRRRRPAWAALLLGCSVAAVVVAITVDVLLLAVAGAAATAAYAAWIGLSACEFLDLIDDATAPPLLLS